VAQGAQSQLEDGHRLGGRAVDGHRRQGATRSDEQFTGGRIKIQTFPAVRSATR
jgi:hypothetical protein